MTPRTIGDRRGMRMTPHSARVGGKSCGLEHERRRFVVHRHEGGPRQAAAAARHKLRTVVGAESADEQHDRLDLPPPRFLHEADLRHHGEELLEQAVAEVDDGGPPIVGDQPVEQRHLAARIGDVDGPDQVGEVAGQRRFARIEIVADQRLAAERKNSINSRAISVLPTRGCGEAMM